MRFRLALSLTVLSVVACLPPPPVDVDNIIGNHQERQDPGSPTIVESELSARLVGEQLELQVPVELLTSDAEVEVTIVDGSSEETQGQATVSVSGEGRQTATLRLDKSAGDGWVPAGQSFGVLGQYIVVVSAKHGSATHLVRRDLFRMTRYLDATVLVPREIPVGADVPVRVVVKDSLGALLGGVTVTGQLSAGVEGEAPITATATSDAQGEALVLLGVPASAGALLTVDVELGDDGSEGRWGGQVTVVGSSDVLLTTDQPRYQPGQTMHLRALAFGSDRAPYVGPVRFEVTDGNGTLIFR